MFKKDRVAGKPFTDLENEVISCESDWEAYAVGREPYEDCFNTIPCDYDKRLTAFEKLLLVKIFRPEKIADAISMYLETELGKDFSSNPVSSIESLFQASDSGTPIIFVLSQGVDPSQQIMDYAKKQPGGENKLKQLSLGQGQGLAAKKLIEEGMVEGHWVMLQNCHLFKSWLPELAQKVASIQEQRDTRSDEVLLHPDFRLILTSMPVDYFPTSVLQSGLKMTTEPPRGIKNNLARSYMNIITQEVYDQLNVHADATSRDGVSRMDSDGGMSHKNSISMNVTLKSLKATVDHFTSGPVWDSDSLRMKNREWRNLLFGLSFFHAVIQERRKFGPLGWNIFYDFNDADFTTTITMIKNFLTENEEVPWEAM